MQINVYVNTPNKCRGKEHPEEAQREGKLSSGFKSWVEKAGARTHDELDTQDSEAE